MNNFELKECVCCGSSNLVPLLDFKKQPLANNLNEHTEPYPLGVNLCKDCWHLQLPFSVDPKLLFSEYLYVSGTSQTLRDYFDWFARFVKEYSPASSNVLEIACNDGSQLNSFANIGYKTFGVDPAQNLHELSSVNHKVVCDFFTSESCARLGQKTFDVIVAQNVIAHTPNPKQLFEDCAKFMNDDSLFFIQTSQANMVLNNEFDTVYHEHISFFSVSSMMRLAERTGLNVIDVFKTPVHGTSFVFVLNKQKKNQYKMKNIVDLEEYQGLHNLLTYEKYANRCYQISDELKTLLLSLRSKGYILAGYGAAAKGMTLLNLMDVKLDFIVDDNELKQNKLAPGNLTPIVGSTVLQDLNHSEKVAFIPLAWNFFAEIRNRILNLRNVETDVFIKYFPEVEVVYENGHQSLLQ